MTMATEKDGRERLPVLAQSVGFRGARRCPELGAKPTCRLNARTSHFDPTRTFYPNGWPLVPTELVF
jgi:hypothetical protein